MHDDVNMAKIYESKEEILSCVKDNHTLMVGGFGLIGAPLTLIDGLI